MGFLFSGDLNALKLVMTVARPYEYNKSYRTVHFKWVNYMSCELYLNKTVAKYWISDFNRYASKNVLKWPIET